MGSESFAVGFSSPEAEDTVSTTSLLLGEAAQGLSVQGSELAVDKSEKPARTCSLVYLLFAYDSV